VRASILSVDQVIENAELPHGLHVGTWGGNTINLQIGNKKFRLKCDRSIRTPNTLCRVTVNEDKQITVETDNSKFDSFL